MSAPYLRYTRELWEKFRYRAAWLPNTHLVLGDVGTLQDGIFEPVTSLARLGISFAVEPSGNGIDLSYTSSDAVTTTAKANAAGGAAGAAISGKLTIEFRSKNAMLFQASNGVVSRIADLRSLGNQIMKRYQQGRWDREHVVLTDLVSVAAATILISDGNSARIELDVDGEPAPSLASLAKAGVKLGIAHEAGIGTRIVGETGLTPLFKVAGIRSRLFHADEFAKQKSGDKSEDLRFVEIDGDDETWPDWISDSG